MEEKIKEAKTAILNRIIKAVQDVSKTIPVVSLETLSMIAYAFDLLEIDKTSTSAANEELKNAFNNLSKLVEEETLKSAKIELQNSKKIEEGL